MIFFLILSLLFIFWLAFMLIFPEKWGSIVDTENAFWVKKGILKEATVERFVRFEKGKGLKIIVTILIAFSLVNAWLFSL